MVWAVSYTHLRRQTPSILSFVLSQGWILTKIPSTACWPNKDVYKRQVFLCLSVWTPKRDETAGSGKTEYRQKGKTKQEAGTHRPWARPGIKRRERQRGRKTWKAEMFALRENWMERGHFWNLEIGMRFSTLSRFPALEFSIPSLPARHDSRGRIQKKV